MEIFYTSKIFKIGNSKFRIVGRDINSQWHKSKAYYVQGKFGNDWCDMYLDDDKKHLCYGHDYGGAYFLLGKLLKHLGHGDITKAELCEPEPI